MEDRKRPALQRKESKRISGYIANNSADDLEMELEPVKKKGLQRKASKRMSGYIVTNADGAMEVNADDPT